MSKKTIIIILICIIAVLASGIGIATSGVMDPYEQQIKLGYKLISESNYTEAILTFNKAIEIDIKNEKAYIGLADAFVTGNDDKTIDDANEALKRGYEQSKSVLIADAYLRLAEELIERDKQDLAIKLLGMGLEVTGDKRIISKRAELIEALSYELMKKLYDLCEKNELDAVRSIMNTKEYTNIVATVMKDKPLIYIEASGIGRGVGIYFDKYLYYGDYVESERVGNGIWIIESSDYHYLFTGKWVDDKPNGEGETISTSDCGSEFNKGSVVNGLWEGDVLVTYEEGDEWILTFTAGKVNVLETTIIEGKTNYVVCYQSLNQDWYDLSFEGDGMDHNEGVFGFLD